MIALLVSVDSTANVTATRQTATTTVRQNLVCSKVKTATALVEIVGRTKSTNPVLPVQFLLKVLAVSVLQPTTNLSIVVLASTRSTTQRIQFAISCAPFRWIARDTPTTSRVIV